MKQKEKLLINKFNPDKLFSGIFHCKNFWQFGKNLNKNKHSIINFIGVGFDVVKSFEISAKTKKQFSYQNDIMLYGTLSQEYITDFNNYLETSFLISEDINYYYSKKSIENLEKIKDFICMFDNYSFRYIWEPVFINNLAKSIKSLDQDSWQKIKIVFLFGLSNSFDEYQRLYDFFNKLECFVFDDKWGKFKIWGFWFITLPFFVILASIFLPFGVFVSLLVLVGGMFYKLLVDIYSKTDYRINFNIGINTIAGTSLVVFFLSSIFLTDFDSYKRGYEKMSGFVNIMSASNTVDVLSSLGSMDVSNPKSFSDSKLNDTINTNYIENTQKQYHYNLISDQIQKYDNKQQKDKSNKMFFEGKKQSITNSTFLWNLVEKIYQKHNLENGVNFSEKEKYQIFIKVIQDYTNLKIDKFRNQSISNVSGTMHWNELSKWLPNGFEIDMHKLEKILVSNIQKNK
ncbi:hypothetical protein [Candidatus Absconditicoccus praedator]|uniref:hypothetical protein n=1 Tax=Candidatus Absconditicoccus praedator TaxID=2735562 RepID=UPI001E28291C|nr:hypothetical protein [Candidatus Absconditicoccus praedator]UFX83234.1 hypothetical protein HLG78_03840 [Candidatus Absconditicoccus praedator]